jgi:tRNA(Arg) A34 adenosine deaminase TadA
VKEGVVRYSNHPFGAVLVHEGRVIVEAENTVNSDQDITAHAVSL